MEPTISEERQYVVFRLGTESFGIDIGKAREIIVYRETIKIPGTQKLIEGIINLRGSIIPIFNLHKKFGFQEVEKSGSTRIVVVEACGSTIGIIVDNVSEVLEITGDAVEKPSPIITTGIDVAYIYGIAKLEERLVILLDLDKIIDLDLAKAM